MNHTTNNNNQEQLLHLTLQAERGLACGHCMESPSSSTQYLEICSGCKRIQYCNKQCQKLNWKIHKPICKIIQCFMKDSKTISIINNRNLLGVVHLKRSKVLERFHEFQTLSKGNHNSDIIGQIEDDYSWTTARKLIMAVPQCSFCHEYEYGLCTTSWTSCNKCQMGQCCTKDHYRKYKSKHTDEICANYQKAFAISTFRYNDYKYDRDSFRFQPIHSLNKPLVTFPNSWEEYFQIRCPTEYSEKHHLPKEFFPLATEELTKVNSCLYSMYQHDKDLYTTIRTLTIHVVGASTAFELSHGGPSCIWEEIMHCLPAIQTLNVVFIGPDSFDFAEHGFTYISCCPSCQSKGKKRSISFYKGTYHEYYQDTKKYFKQPDLIVAFNTGMYEEYTESWKQSLNVILDLNVPSYFTSYNKQESIEDFKILHSLNACTLTDTPMKNPFSTDYPLIDTSGIDTFFEINCYGTCFKGRK